jgi:stage V sporulation protein AD
MAVLKRIGERTAVFGAPPSVISFACAGGKQEGRGPLGAYFDEVNEDSFFGERTWEKGESAMQKRALQLALLKGARKASQLDYILAGDLLNQCIGSSFSLRNSGIPFLGLYGACSTFGEGLALAAMLIDGGFARCAAALTSSHFCTAERQYRMPVPYGSQRTPTAQWTATAAGCCILGESGPGPYLTAAAVGRIVDKGITDANNMGAAMAPAAYQTLSDFLRDTGTNPGDYDLILTGDLGELGHAIVCDLFRRDGTELGDNYQDCGMLLYDRERQDMHAGGSGCGCSAAVVCGYVLRGMREGRWRRVLLAPTGALLSPTSSFQGESIPGICHAVCFSSEKECFPFKNKREK